jgi:xanthosine utilization system XapX-like protein
MPAGHHGRFTSWIAAALYLVAAVSTTWPLATVMHREIAWDMGDPLFNSWVLMWTGGQVLAFLSGDFSALGRFWHGNIFHPEPLTVAYSEHLVPQMVQALPVLAATDNVVLAYNLLFLSTFVLSGLGVFLLVRTLTGSATAGFIAGLAFAFAPYRLAQFSHLQVLSSQWMPFVLYGYRRYFETGRRTPLVGGTAALVLQNLSCGYYMLFFAPFVALYVVYEMASRGRLRDWPMWRTWVAAGALALAVTYPFLDPYFDVRKTGNVGVRDMGEIVMFSADTHAFVTPSGWSWLWGERLIGLLRPEGEGFPGITIAGLALIGVLVGARRAMRAVRNPASAPLPPWHQALVGLLALLVVTHIAGVVMFLVTGGLPIPFQGAWAIHRNADGVFLRTAMLVALLTIVSPGVRRFLRGTRDSLLGFFVLSAALAAVLALGPQISAAGHLIGTGPYAWLMAFVPGFDGVRVPARFLMLVALFLACLAGYGAAALLHWRPRAAVGVLTAASLVLLLESWAGPFQTNTRLAAEEYETTPRVLRTANDLPPIYKVLRDDPEPVILVEFPFGSPAWDLHSVFYAGYHRRSLVNGYSGFFPESQKTLTSVFTMVGSDPDAAWRALVGTRATHVLVREGAYRPSRRHVISDWLRARGAEEILLDGQDRLFRMKTP